jgi:4-hydroxy-tetrahydrodipicolinate synthase
LLIWQRLQSRQADILSRNKRFFVTLWNPYEKLPQQGIDSIDMDVMGCGTALVTPFRENGSIDEHALCSLVNWQIESGINFLVACGSTGEAATLNDDEWLHAVRLVIESTAGRVPVWGGCTVNATREAVEKATKLAKIPGVDAILTASPYYNKPSQEGQYLHFRAMAQAVSPIPVVLYNIPGRTGVQLLPETVLRIAEDVPNVVGIKDSGANLAQTARMVHTLPSYFKVYCGDDNLALPALAVGAAGLVSVASNQIPSEMAQMVNRALQGDWAAARGLNKKYFPLMEANFLESNPGPVKAVLAMMGRMKENCRLPLVPPSRETKAKLEKLASELGLLTHHLA